MRKLEEKTKTTFVKIEPSQIGQLYKYIELKCVCCRRTFFKGDIREDPDKITGQEKPLCPNCAKHYVERLCKWKQKLRQLLKEYPKERCAFVDGKISGELSMSFNEVEWLKKFEELLK
jgi:hypothetical protein